jgi:hypothetical protein
MRHRLRVVSNGVLSHLIQSINDFCISEGKPTTSVATNPPRESNDLSGTGQEHGNVLRGDIILFYNKIYVSEMKEFAMRFAGQGNENDNLLLSPLPATVRNNVTPKKVKGLPLTIHPLEKNINELLESPTSLSYIMSSPTKGSVSDANVSGCPGSTIFSFFFADHPRNSTIHQPWQWPAFAQHRHGRSEWSATETVTNGDPHQGPSTILEIESMLHTAGYCYLLILKWCFTTSEEKYIKICITLFLGWIDFGTFSKYRLVVAR